MQTKPIQRLVALDAFRGIIIAGMILVTDPGTYDFRYAQLGHADWEGATATDMIFPSFLFMVGFSIALSLTSRLKRGESKGHIARHVFYRCVILVILGLAVNGFPTYHWHTLRLPGILQRIGICYLCCGLFYLFANNFKQENSKPITSLIKTGILAVLLLAGYWLILAFAPVPGIGAGYLDSYRNFTAYIDRCVFGLNHMWAYGLTPGMGVTYDPEGILSIIPAIASTFIGVMAGQWWLQTRSSSHQKVVRLEVWGIVLIAAGLLLSHYIPVNKRIWTPSFALISSGVAILLFSLLYAIIDLGNRRKWATPFLILGSNAILAFVVSSVITSLNDTIHINHHGKLRSLHELGNFFCLDTKLSPVNASLLYAVIIVVINVLIIYPFYRKKLFVRI